MLALAIVSIILAVLGIGISFYIALAVNRSTTKLFNHIEAILIAPMTSEQHEALVRAVKDIEKTGEKQAQNFLGDDGKWHVAFDRKITVKVGIKAMGKHVVTKTKATTE